MGDYRAKKRFGQHFLVDGGVIDAICHAISPRSTDHMFEIGPGRGALTEHLVGRAGQLDLVELDWDCVAYLRERFGDQVVLHEADALAFPFDAHCKGGSFRVVGNLPYNISTPLLFHLLTFAAKVQDMHFMLQEEVVDRIVARPSTKAYGRLTVMLQSQCEVDKLFRVGAEAFSPPPRVSSAVVRLRPKALYDIEDKALFDTLVRTLFVHRRKTLRYHLRNWLSDDQIKELSLDVSMRPEACSVASFVAIANFLSAGGIQIGGHR